MNQYKTEPEFMVEESEKTLHMVNHLRNSSTILLDGAVVELRLLSKELSMSVDILEKIRDSVLVLEQSLEEH